MEQNVKYSYTIDDKSPHIAIINLGNKVLGGNDALQFSTKLNELSKNDDIRFVIINLASVEVMNSSGLGMLVSGLSTLRKHDKNLVLTDVPQKVNSLLLMTHLDKVFEIYGSIEEAYKKLS